MLTYNQVKGSAEFIMAQTRVRPKIAIILGTGQSSIASEIEGAVRIPYKNIPRWNATTQKSHEGVLIIGTLDRIPVAVLSGRLHFYEGNSFAECAYPIAVLKALGVEKIIMTNAAGGINTEYNPGDFVMAFMGFVEVLKHLGSIMGFMRTVKAEISANRPDALILIDYPSFNLRVAEYAHSIGIPVFYFISPKVWAWTFAEEIWENLNEENKISLFVRFVSLADGTREDRMINKNK